MCLLPWWPACPVQRVGRSLLRRLLAACVTTSAVLTMGGLAGCGVNTSSDPLQVSNRLVAATPAESPPASRAPAGTVEPAPAADQAVFDTATGTLALAGGTSITLRHGSGPPQTVSLPAPAASVNLARSGGAFLVSIPARDVVLKINARDGSISSIPVTGGPVAATETTGELAVAQANSKSVVFLRGGKVTRTVAGFAGPAQLIASGADVLVLDRLSTALIEIKAGSTEKGVGLRAGAGATNAVGDRFGRTLVTDTRGGQLLAFSSDPLIMKQRYPVGQAPYGIAYDPVRDLAWITLTRSNEVVGYGVASGEPVERYRFPAVRQPDAVAVNPATGEVFVSSASGDGVQVVKP